MRGSPRPPATALRAFYFARNAHWYGSHSLLVVSLLCGSRSTSISSTSPTSSLGSQQIKLTNQTDLFHQRIALSEAIFVLLSIFCPESPVRASRDITVAIPFRNCLQARCRLKSIPHATRWCLCIPEAQPTCGHPSNVKNKVREPLVRSFCWTAPWDHWCGTYRTSKFIASDG